MSTPPGDAKRARREEARAKAAKLQAEAQAAERRRKGIWAALATLLIAAVAIGITFAVKANQKDKEQLTAGFGTQGVVAIPGPAGSKTAASDAVTIRTGFDYMCPICKNFEAETAAWQEQQAKAGAVKRELLPVAILDQASQGTKFSTRSAGAAYAVAAANPAKLNDFTKSMFAAQPAEGSSGLTNEQILQLAKTAVPNNEAMDKAIKNNSYNDYVSKVTEQASKDGLAGTPTVWVNGKIIKFTNGSGFLPQLQKAVADAKAAAKSSSTKQ